MLATATYRLLPHIIIKKPIPPEYCDKFAKCFSPGVIEVRENDAGEKEAVVANPRRETMSREVYRHKEFDDAVELTRIRDFFMCESGSLLKTCAVLDISWLHSQHRVDRRISAARSLPCSYSYYAGESPGN